MTSNRRKTPKAIAYASVIALVGLSVLSACGSGETQREGDSVLVDKDPNAQLGNNELFTIALSDMKALNSFQVEFTENPKDLRWDPTLFSYQPNTTTELSSTLAITAEMQKVNKQGHFKLIYGDPEKSGPDQETVLLKMMAGTSRHATDLLLAENNVYESIDGGTRWMQLGPGSAGYVLLPVIQYALPFGIPDDTSTAPDYLGYLTKDLVFEDGKPKLEEIDGTITRHMVAVLTKPTLSPTENADNMTTIWVQRAESIDLWVSTNAEPKIVQMSIVVSSMTSEYLRQEMDLPDKVLYDLNWRWSQFNDDLGIIERPSGDALITPSP